MKRGGQMILLGDGFVFLENLSMVQSKQIRYVVRTLISVCCMMFLYVLFFCFFEFSSSALAEEAVFSGVGNSVYFFKDGAFVRYQKGASQPDQGYPKPINKKTWPGLSRYRMDITAAMRVDDDAYFFLSDGRYIKYDLKGLSVHNGYPRIVSNDNWSGLATYAKDISAAIRYNDTYAYFFLSDGRYLLYNLQKQQMSSDSPQSFDGSEWRGIELGNAHIQSMFSWNNGKIYCFLSNQSYLRFDRYDRAFESGYPRNISEETWPGLEFWDKPRISIRTKKWNGELIKTKTRVAFVLPRRMLGPITTGPKSQENGRYLSVDPFLSASSSTAEKKNIFTLYPIEKRQEEGLQNNHPGVYQKVIIQAKNGMFLGVSQAHGGLLRADREQSDATVFIMDQTWGDRVALHVYQRNFQWKNRSAIPMVSRYLSTYFYSYGDHTYGSINPEGSITAGTLLDMYLVSQ